MNHKHKILFICKQRPAGYGASYGLLNSCRFLCNALHDMGIHAELIEVVDNNGIDKEVHHYKPTHVFIEALWVVPEKFEILIPLHPNVKWFVRLHSNTPFIANEGMAMDWIIKYGKLQKEYHQFKIAPNSLKMENDLFQSLHISTTYLPNIYKPTTAIVEYLQKTKYVEASSYKYKNTINISCMGAIRPLKNQLIQAMAAIVFANELGRILHFHINHSRIENNGENIYKNIVALFNGTQHKLIEHGWIDHCDFINLIKTMDIGMQVSFSETFNFVSADHIDNNIPIVGSPDIEWTSRLYQANPTDINNIVYHLWIAWIGKKINLQSLNKCGLEAYNIKSISRWQHVLEINN